MTKTRLVGCVGCVRLVRLVGLVGWVGLVGLMPAATAGCGGATPTSPAPAVTLSGNWTGTFEYQTAGVTVKEDASLILNQSSSLASGSWNATSGSSGTLSLSISATPTGSFTISQPNLGTAACTASATVSGTASSTDLVVNVADLTRTASCPWASAMKFTLKK